MGSTNKFVEEVIVVSSNLFMIKPAESLPEIPADPLFPEVPEVPLEPFVPVMPEVPLEPEPEVPLEPLSPLDPDDPDDPRIVCGDGTIAAKFFCNKAIFTAFKYLSWSSFEKCILRAVYGIAARRGPF